jgi:hypothetical protein
VRKRTDIPTSYSAGCKAEKPSKPWETRLWLRASTTIQCRQRMSETVYPVGAFGQTHPTKARGELLCSSSQFAHLVLKIY